MVEEIIQEIQQAEQQAADLLEQARKSARDIINQGAQQAKQKAEEITAAANKQAEDLVSKAEADAKQKADRHVADQIARIDRDADKARRNIDAAAKLIMERVV